MSSFLDLEHVQVSRQLAEETHLYLREIGKQGKEAVALWAGSVHDDIFHVKNSIVPQQVAVVADHGLCYFVSGEELHRINVWLYRNSVELIAQIHSHPQEAYHSSTDDRYPIITSLGGLSLVAPDFASAPFHLRDYAIFRLLPDQGWVRLGTDQASGFIIIEG